MMRFSVNERIDGTVSAAKVSQLLEAQFQKIAISITRDGPFLKVKSIEATFGSINREDETTVSVRQVQGGLLLEADVDYKPSTAFWVFVVVGILFWFVGAAVPIGFYLWHKEVVKKAIEYAFQNVRNEVGGSIAGQPQPSAMVAPFPSDLHAEASVAESASSMEPYEQIEKLGELLEKNLLTQQEFDFKKAEILGMPTDDTFSHPVDVFDDDLITNKTDIPLRDLPPIVFEEDRASNEIWILRNGKTVGPMPDSRLWEFVKAKKLKQSDQIRFSTDGPWMTASDALGKLKKIGLIASIVSAPLNAQDQSVQAPRPRAGIYFV